MRYLLLAVTAALALTGCGGDSRKTDDLREYLRQAHEFDDPYEGLGTVTYEDGAVTIDTEAWADPGYGAYLYCSWVEPWVRENGNADTDIVVIMDGREILRSRGASEPCVEAEPQT